MDSDNRRETQPEPDNTKQVTLEDISGFAKVLDVLITSDLIPEGDRMKLGEAVDEISNLAHANDTVKPQFLKVWLPDFLGITEAKAASEPPEDETDPEGITDRREFNLLNFKILEVDFTVVDFLVGDVEFSFNYNHRDGDADMDFMVVNGDGDSIPSQLLSCNFSIPVKANAKELKTKIRIPAGESREVKFNFDDQPLFIVRVNGQDSSVWFLSYDLAGNELAALCVQRPKAEQRSESIEDEASKAETKRNFFSAFAADDLAGAICWLNLVIGMQSVSDLAHLVDYLIEKTTGASDSLEQLRYAMFLESDIFAEAYELYKVRYRLRNQADPAKLVKNIIEEHAEGRTDES